MSDHGSEQETNSNTGQMSSSGEQELASKLVQIQHKRFYLDVKQNQRGRFFKVAEVGAAGRKSRLLLAMSTAAEFRDLLNVFNDHYSKLGPLNPDHLPEDGKLKSEIIVKDNRRYYLDLKENNRGRFLRVSQTISKGSHRSQIAIPAQGLVEFRDALTDLLDEYGLPDGGEEKNSSFRGELPDAKQMRIDKKKFFFDIGQNSLGVYMRISEVKNNFRSSITIPEKSWSRFRDIFNEYVEKMIEHSDVDKTSTGNNSAVAGGGSNMIGGTQTGGDSGVVSSSK